MTIAAQVAAALCAAACLAASWVLWRVHAGRLTTVATAASGVVPLADLALDPASKPVSLTVAVVLAIGPVALVSYPSFNAARSRVATGAALAAILCCAIAAVWRSEWVLGFEIAVVLILIGRAWLVIERGTAPDRTATQWMIAAVIFAVLAGELFLFSYQAIAPSGGGDPVQLVSYLLALLIPLAMIIGVVQPDVIDVRWLVTTITLTLTLIFCFLAAASTIVYGVEAFSGQALSTSIVLAICSLLALGVAPARRWLYDSLERMLFGGRPDAISALAVFAGRIGNDLADALDAVREALVLPFARLDVAGRPAITSGIEVPHVTSFPLDIGPDRAATLFIGMRPGERSWSKTDLGIIGLVAPLVASTVRAQLLAEQVSVSRREAVAAIEDERRRLRRDLHDGVGPLLSGVVFTADAAGNLIHRDPATAGRLLAELRGDAAAAIIEVRQLVEGLRPPALDELGLIGALRAWCHGLRAAGGIPVSVRFEGDSQIDGLPTAGEAAAYRIAVEALTNVARHSGTHEATVRFTQSDSGWQMEICDSGASGTWAAGVGISSMRERAEAVGGELEAGAGVVRLTLPSDG